MVNGLLPPEAAILLVGVAMRQALRLSKSESTTYLLASIRPDERQVRTESKHS